MVLRTHATVLLAVLLLALACAGPACGIACGLAMPCHGSAMMADCGMSASIHASPSDHRMCGLDDAIVLNSVMDNPSAAHIIIGSVPAVGLAQQMQRARSTALSISRQSPPHFASVLRV